MAILAVLIDPFLLPGTQSHSLLDVVAMLSVLFFINKVIESNDLTEFLLLLHAHGLDAFELRRLMRDFLNNLWNRGDFLVDLICPYPLATALNMRLVILLGHSIEVEGINGVVENE